MEIIRKDREYDIAIFTAKPKDYKYPTAKDKKLDETSLNRFINETSNKIIDESTDPAEKDAFYKLENNVLSIEITKVLKHLINEDIPRENWEKESVVDYLLETDLHTADKNEIYGVINDINRMNKIKGYLVGIIDAVRVLNPTCKINLIY